MQTIRALENAILHILVRTFFPWDACFLSARTKNPVAER